MKAQELKIGNWVNYLDLPIQVDGIDDVDVFNSQTGEIPLHCIFPIPLTEEWLLKFGFEGSPSDYKKEKLSITLKGSDVYHIKGRVYFNSWAIIEEQLKYVHQLQNLFFALTGEELKISPKTL